MKNLIDKCIADHIECFNSLDTDAIYNVGKEIALALGIGRTVYICGNGGSAADAQHFAAEIVGRFQKERVPWSCQALTTDTSILTAIGNDYGYDKIFERQIWGMGKVGDILIGISTSGKSVNVIDALNKAKIMGLITIALFGNDDSLGTVYNHCVSVKNKNTARVQEAHIFILHVWAAIIETKLS